MQLPALRKMLFQARELATHKNTSLEEACLREQEIERMLAAARSEKEERAGSAQSTNALVAALQQQIERQEAGAGAEVRADCKVESDGNGLLSARAALERVIRELLLEQGEATTKEITQHVERVLPDVNVKNTSPLLTRLVQQGRLVRPRGGVYRLGGEWAGTSHI